MPTAEYAAMYYKKFGVKAYHDHDFYGQSTSIYIIDMGLTNTEESLRNVKTRTLINPMGRRNTHGSFVASIIGKMGSYAPNGDVPGIAPDAQIYLADVSDSQGAIYTSTLIKAIQDAIDLRVDIISISLGTDVYDQRLENVVNDAAKKNILVFAAAGNCNCRTYEFPAACESAISVASMDSNRRLSVFNTRNDAVAVFAPGQNIKVPGSSRLSGTSFAVPFASGLAALELSRRRAILPCATIYFEKSKWETGFLSYFFFFPKSHTCSRNTEKTTTRCDGQMTSCRQVGRENTNNTLMAVGKAEEQQSRNTSVSHQGSTLSDG